MTRRHVVWAAATLVLSLSVVLGACARTAGPTGTSPSDPAEPARSLATEMPTPSPAEPLTEEFPYGDFDEPTTIDNPWLPLTPGTQWRWEGQTVEDDEVVPHAIVLAVTDLTKVIDGVTAVVALDQDFADGSLAEAEIVFLAQDNDGNLWHLGQFPEEYDEGRLVDAPAWIAGIEGAKAGLWMTADPRVGDRSYSQGWGPAVDWTDRGRVIQLGMSDCVAYGCFEEVLVIEEWALDEPLARQLKFYARDVGNIRVDWSGSADQEQETLELVEFRQLTADELEGVRRHALELEARAYQLQPDVYGDTDPMRPRS